MQMFSPNIIQKMLSNTFFYILFESILVISVVGILCQIASQPHVPVLL